MCKAEWPGNKYVGERAITTTEQYLQGRRRSGNPAAARQSGGGVNGQVDGQVDGNTEDDEEEAEEEGGDGDEDEDEDEDET